MDLQAQALGLGNKPALIVVDMTNGFTDPDSPLGAECSSVKVAISRLLTEFRNNAWSIYFTGVEYDAPEQARVVREKIPALNILKVGSHWTELDPSMTYRSGEKFIKKFWASAFFKTGLADMLEAEQIDSLVVCGLTTSGCVRATAVDGLQGDFRVVIPREACGDRNQQAHEANLFDLNAKYIDVVSLEECLTMMAAV